MHPEFPHQGIVHLNHAGVGPWPARSARAAAAFAQENSVSGSKNYPEWLARETATRVLMQRLLNAEKSEDIAFAKSTSAALSTVAFGMPWIAGQNIVIPADEFPSNRIPWLFAAQRFGLELREVTLSFSAPEADLLAACDTNTALLACSAVQFASGLRINLEALGQVLRQREIAFCVDGIQHLGALPFDLAACQADFVMADAHKWLLGPEGIALFYVHPRWRDRLQLNEYGWHTLADSGDYQHYELTLSPSARRFEPGSPNLLGCFAFHESLALLLETGLENVAAAIDSHWHYLREGLQALDCEILTPVSRRAGILTFRPSGIQPVELFQHLQRAGILCALRGGGVRFSPHFYLTQDALDCALAAVKECLYARGNGAD